MINLLNPDDLTQLKAARLNVSLRRFAVLSALIMLGVASIFGIGFWLAYQDRSAVTRQHQSAQQELDKYKEAVDTAATYRSNLKTAKQILNREMVFSTFLTDLGALMPAGTIIEDLSLSTTTDSRTPGAINFTARAKSYDAVLLIKQSLESSKLLSDVRIGSTSTPEERPTSGIESTYPYEATFEVVVNALKGSAK